MEENRDIVCVGASAGGIEALSELVAGLPPDLPAALFIVQHMSAGMPSALPDILARRGPLKATLALHGDPIVPGQIYVAPPDNHLMVRPGHVDVVRGPRENGSRPAVDALFRTASRAYGPRVIGVVLTGYLDCGTAGLLSIKARGGLAIVQDPHEAAVPAMPRSAIDHVAVDHVAPVRAIADLIARLVREPAGAWPPVLPRALTEIEGDELGAPADVVCPLCQGTLTTSQSNGFQFFRCHVGHAFSHESVAAAQAEALEHALWAATRALEESARMAHRIAMGATGEQRERFMEKAKVQTQQARLVRGVMDGGVLSLTDAPGVPLAPTA